MQPNGWSIKRNQNFSDHNDNMPFNTSMYSWVEPIWLYTRMTNKNQYKKVMEHWKEANKKTWMGEVNVILQFLTSKWKQQSIKPNQITNKGKKEKKNISKYTNNNSMKRTLQNDNKNQVVKWNSV